MRPGAESESDTLRSSYPRCPRCGYDQSGLVATWRESCPLEATCTECGYAFNPADAIDPRRRRLPWLYEHARRWLSVRAYAITLAMVFWPPAFWKRVRPEHEVRVGRLIVMMVWPFPAVVVAYVLLFYAEIVTSFRGAWMVRSQGRIATWGEAFGAGTMRFMEFIASGEVVTAFREYFFGVGVLFLPLVFLWLPPAAAFVAVPSEWVGSRLTKKHMVRLLAYAAWPFTLAPVGALLWGLGLGVYRIVYYLQPGWGAPWPAPWRISVPSAVPIGGMAWLTLVWPPLYWFFAIRRGYELRSTMRPFLVVMAVFLTPWTLFLLHTVYWAIVE